MAYLLDFGESGKKFIEIGKRTEPQQTILNLTVE
jgi:hypothetical protein